jgi:hypothetical protein
MEFCKVSSNSQANLVTKLDDCSAINEFVQSWLGKITGITDEI